MYLDEGDLRVHLGVAMDGILDVANHPLNPVLLELVQGPLRGHLVANMMQGMMQLDGGQCSRTVSLQAPCSHDCGMLESV